MSEQKLRNNLLASQRETLGALPSDGLILLYFSASWCPPCRAFTPLLKSAYPMFKDNNVEIVFVSRDHSKQHFEEYYATMPWLAVDYKNTQYRQELSEARSKNQIPFLWVLDRNGKSITEEGTADIRNLGAEVALKKWNEMRQ